MFEISDMEGIGVVSLTEIQEALGQEVRDILVKHLNLKVVDEAFCMITDTEFVRAMTKETKLGYHIIHSNS